jgi:hypothetical protein
MRMNEWDSETDDSERLLDRDFEREPILGRGRRRIPLHEGGAVRQWWKRDTPKIGGAR